MSEAASRNAIVSRDFNLLWSGSLAFSTSFQLLLTALPVYALQLGAREAEIGLVIGAFSAAAMLWRLPTGWLIDRGRRVPLLVAGAAIFALAGVGYLGVVSIAGLLLLRLFHGSGMALFTTAGQTLVVDVAPRNRRGEALGFYTISNNLAMGLGPAAGAVIVGLMGFPALFAGTSALALVAVVLCALVAEPKRPPRTGPRPRLFNGAVVFPGLLLFAQMSTYGAVASFVPILALGRGLENSGLFFLTYAGAMVVAQALGGRASDRHGRLAVTLPGLALSALGMVAVVFAQGWWLLGAGALYGLGAGIVQPALFAAAGDLVPSAERGSAMATMGLFLEIGIGGGSIVAGLIAQQFGVAAAFGAAATVPVAAIIGAALALRSRARHMVFAKQSGDHPERPRS